MCVTSPPGHKNTTGWLYFDCRIGTVLFIYNVYNGCWHVHWFKETLIYQFFIGQILKNDRLSDKDALGQWLSGELFCHCRKSTGETNFVNDGSVPKVSQWANVHDTRSLRVSCCFPALTPKRRLVNGLVDDTTGDEDSEKACVLFYSARCYWSHERCNCSATSRCFIVDVVVTLYLWGKYYRDINRKLQINILYPGICFMFM